MKDDLKTGRGRRLKGRAVSALIAALVASTLAPAAADAGDWKLEPFGIKNKQAGFEAKLTGYFQFDFRSFRWSVSDPAQRSDTADLRRARFGTDLEWKRLSASFDLDLSEPGRELIHDNNPPYAGAEVKNGYAQYRFTKAFSLRAGTFKLPIAYEFLTSASKTDFVERSMLVAALGIDRDFGVMALGEIAGRINYQAGVFAGDGRTNPHSAGTTVAARAVVSVVGPLDLAASFSHGRVAAAPDGPGTDPIPKGLRGQSPSGYRFYERKFVDGRRSRIGLEGELTRGPFQLKGEWLQAREERRRQGSTFGDLPSEVGTGWSATASFILTGEKKQRTLMVGRPLSKGGPGLVELALRYESLRFDDSGPATGFEGAGNRARNLRPSQDRVLWGGVSWMPTQWIRLFGDVYRERYLDELLAPEPPGARFVSGTPRGRGGYVTLVARVQLMLP